jgi:hypothetical protein
VTTDEAHEWFDDAAWDEAMRALPDLDHKDLWRTYCAGGEL